MGGVERLLRGWPHKRLGAPAPVARVGVLVSGVRSAVSRWALGRCWGRRLGRCYGAALGAGGGRMKQRPPLPLSESSLAGVQEERRSLCVATLRHRAFEAIAQSSGLRASVWPTPQPHLWPRLGGGHSPLFVVVVPEASGAIGSKAVARSSGRRFSGWLAGGGLGKMQAPVRLGVYWRSMSAQSRACGCWDLSLNRPCDGREGQVELNRTACAARVRNWKT